MKRIAIIWGNHRNDLPWTVHHLFWEHAIKCDQKLEMTRFLWTEIQSIPDGFDLYFFPDFSPVLFRLPEKRLRPRALYWWDSFHWTFTYVAQVSDLFDRSYFAEKMTSTTLLTHGCKSASWLPAAFQPDIHCPVPDIEKDLDYAFAGQRDNVVVRNGSTRHEFLKRLSENTKLKGMIVQGVYGYKLANLYSRSKVLFDWTIWDNLGTRIFETIGSGGFTLVNRNRIDNGISQIASDGEHYVSYDGSYEDFEAKLKYYLDNDYERNRIATQGYIHFFNNHTYSHRLSSIMTDFGL